ncbi:MAG TPA: hypothetical protein V6D19_11075 [Stenomitos sp.]
MATALITATYSLPKLELSQINPDQDIGKFTLEEACQSFAIDTQDKIPFWVWLLENPKSLIALPGSIDLNGHDCLHLLLNRGVSAFDEAFVVGFTMGNCDQAKPYHFSVIKTISKFLYPQPFQFDDSHLQVFDLGVKYGQRLKYRNIHQETFDRYRKRTIHDLREKYGILLKEIQILWRGEQILFAA